MRYIFTTILFILSFALFINEGLANPNPCSKEEMIKNNQTVINLWDAYQAKITSGVDPKTMVAARKAILKAETDLEALKKACKEEEVRYSEQDILNTAVATALVEQGAHSNKCTLVAVTTITDGWDRDLYLRSVSDLGAGAVVSSDLLLDEAGFIVGIVGSKPTIQLLEKGVLIDRTLVTGKDLKEFKTKALAAGFKVAHEVIECQSKNRLSEVNKVITLLQNIK